MTKAKKQGEKRAPAKMAGNGDRDPKTGQFLVGHPGGPGRPRRPDLYSLVKERGAAADIDIEADLLAITRGLIAQARAGDVQAAKLLFERLTDNEPVKIEHSGKVTLESLVLGSIRKEER